MIDVDNLQKESRESHEKFHQHWSILAGGSLTVLIAFVKDFATIANPEAKSAFLFALLFLAGTLILSPLRNLLSVMLVGMMVKPLQKGEIQRTVYLAFLCNMSALLSIAAYILGMLLVTYSLYISYLK